MPMAVTVWHTAAISLRRAWAGGCWLVFGVARVAYTISLSPFIALLIYLYLYLFIM